ncbi:hypothetical protein [Companilactobacillus jidongensis]|uniref:hypothetical protein n=1 Tax=Companilactobacillus jidongensis TaxID=2486006 RepID=UPI000F76C580|nr:hypothetical protein [Companilactobacillus jidongensis]
MKNKKRIILPFLVIALSLLVAIVNTIGIIAATNADSVTAKINNVITDNDDYNTTVDFQLTNSGSQLILYSPDYDNLDIDYLKIELGDSNVITNKDSHYVIVNLKNKMNDKYAGSFNVEMKESENDNLIVRDMSNNNLAVKSLTSIDSANEINSGNVDISNKPVLNLINAGTEASPVSTGTSYEVTGNWYDYDSQNVDLYYSLDQNDSSKASKVSSYTQSETEGQNLVVHSLDEKINLAGQSGNHTLYFWIKDSDGNWSDVGGSVVNIAASKTVYSGFSRASALMATRALTLASEPITTGPSGITMTLDNPANNTASAPTVPIGSNYQISGTWYSNTTTTFNLYCQFDASKNGSLNWHYVQSFTGSLGQVHKFTATIQGSFIDTYPSGPHRIYLNSTVSGSSSDTNTVIVIPLEQSLEIVSPSADTSADNPYVARNNNLDVSVLLNSNGVGTFNFVIDGTKTNIFTNAGIIHNYPAEKTIDLSTLNTSSGGSANDSLIHKAQYQYVSGQTGQVSSSVDFYFIVGSDFRITAPTIDFGSHDPGSGDNNGDVTAAPTLSGDSLTVYDGHMPSSTGTEGKIQLNLSTNKFVNTTNNKTLAADLYWNGTLISDDSDPVTVGYVDPPTVDSPAYKNFDSELKNNMRLKFNVLNNSSGQYKSIFTWTAVESVTN